MKEKIDGMMFERTAISKKPEKLIKQELEALKDTDKLTPDMVFRFVTSRFFEMFYFPKRPSLFQFLKM